MATIRYWTVLAAVIGFGTSAYGCGGAAGGAAAGAGSAVAHGVGGVGSALGHGAGGVGSALGHGVGGAGSAVGHGVGGIGGVGNAFGHGVGGIGAVGHGVGAAESVGANVGSKVSSHVSENVAKKVIISSITGGGKCIYEEAEIRMANGAMKRVKDLKIGDRVMAHSVEKGVHAASIIGELHKYNETAVPLIEIETSSGRKIPVTPMHSLFVRQCLSDGQTWSTKAAFEVSLGDCVPRYHTEGDVAEESVTNIRFFEARGIRQPVTETGTIIVDDVVISCYDRVVSQDATHLALFPYRWFMGLSKAYITQVKSIIPTLYNLVTFDASLF